jgi:hypothetical protein
MGVITVGMVFRFFVGPVEQAFPVLILAFSFVERCLK